MFLPVPVSAGCEYIASVCSIRFLLRSLALLLDCEAFGVEVPLFGAIDRLLAIFEDADVTLDLKALS